MNTAAGKEQWSVRIRNLTQEDYDRIIPVLNDWWGGRDMADQLPRLFAKHFANTSFVAEEDDQIVGFLIGFISQVDPAAAYIHFAGVSPQRRGERIGAQLYDRFYQVTAAQGCTRAYSVTSVVNQASLRFHRRIGFQVENGDSRDENGVPYTTDYDGPGDKKYRFVISNPYVKK